MSVSSPVYLYLGVAVLAWLAQNFMRTHQLHGPVGMCKDEPSDWVEVDASNNSGNETNLLSGRIRARPCEAFSESYFEARAKFRFATRRLAESMPTVKLHTLPVMPGQDYTIDIAVIPGSGSETMGLTIHSSGCHGVEGFAGSAVQVGFLDHLTSLLENELEPNGDDLRNVLPATTVVLVHVLNPYGMAHYRRFNENNVDLNRNALFSEEWPEVLTRGNVAGYEDFDEALFNPRRAPNLFNAYFTVFVKAAYAIIKYGYVNMKRSLVAGTYEHSHGIFYGGNELQASHLLLQEFLVKEGFTTNAGMLTWIDVHTGLGPSGIDTLLAHGTGKRDGAKGDGAGDYFYGSPRPVQYHFGQGGESDGMGGGDVTSGYDLSRGIMNEYYAKLFQKSSPGVHPLIVTQEFGTVPGILVARGMILENMAYNYAREFQPYWSQFSRDAFYIRTDAWRRSILSRGLIVLRQAIERSSSNHK